jgi:hypothetical protein
VTMPKLAVPAIVKLAIFISQTLSSMEET